MHVSLQSGSGLSDPYCVVIPRLDGTNKEKRKTKTIKKTLNPDWGAEADFRWIFEYTPYLGASVLIQCWDEEYGLCLSVCRSAY